MELIVSDTNVFVALFRCNLLTKVFHNSRVEVRIPSKIYEELTNQGHRIKREYPDLSDLITQLVHNSEHGYPISLTVVNVARDITDVLAVQAYCELTEEPTLDPGELEAIPLAVSLSATFISCDNQAVIEHQGLTQKNNSSGLYLVDYCSQLLDKGIISQREYNAISTAINA